MISIQGAPDEENKTETDNLQTPRILSKWKTWRSLPGQTVQLAAPLWFVSKVWDPQNRIPSAPHTNQARVPLKKRQTHSPSDSRLSTPPFPKLPSLSLKQRANAQLRRARAQDPTRRQGFNGDALCGLCVGWLVGWACLLAWLFGWFVCCLAGCACLLALVACLVVCLHGCLVAYLFGCFVG